MWKIKGILCFSDLFKQKEFFTVFVSMPQKVIFHSTKFHCEKIARFSGRKAAALMYLRVKIWHVWHFY